MISRKRMSQTFVAFAMPLLFAGAAHADPAANKALVSKAMSELFVKRDASAVARYWSKDYVQHNPTIPNGSEELPGMVKSLPATFKYEPGMIVAHDDIVMIRGRYTGWTPNPMIVVDTFRIKGGKLVEHWDVMQEEVPAEKTKSGNPMFRLGE